MRLLSTGTLAPDMIRPTELAQKLHLLNTQLKLSNPGSEVTIIDTAYYYSQPVALYTYSTTHLYIHINVIVSSTHSAFSLYQVISTDVPIDTENTNSTGTTKITTHNNFLAVNEARTLFLEMTNADLLTCQGQILKVCARTIPRIRTDNPTCLMAAFNDDQEGIARLCTFQIQPLKPLGTKAIALGKDKYLVTTDQEYYHIICQHKTPTTKSASAYAVVGVPCLCHLQFDGLYLPNTQIPCNPTESIHYTMHTANVPIIMALAETKTNISPSSLHKTPIIIPHLHTQAIIKAMTPDSNLPRDTTMDLTPFAKKALMDAKIAEGIIKEPLQNTPVAEGVATFFSHSAWSYILPSVLVIDNIVIVLLLFKILGKQTIFAAIPQVAAAPYNISWKHLVKAPTPIEKSDPEVHINQYLDTQNIFYIIIIALIIYVALRTYKHLKERISKHFGFIRTTSKTNPTVTLKIYNGHNNHTIPLICLPYESDVIHRGFIPALLEITALSCPHPRINMLWSGPIVFNIMGEKKVFFLPNHILLPPKARFSVIPALRDPTTTTNLVLKSDSAVMSLPATPQSDITIREDQEEETLINHPRDMTILQLMTAVLKPKPQIGSEN